MKQTRLEQMQNQMVKKLSPDRGQKVSAKMNDEYRTLCESDSEYPKDFIRHLHNNIFPVAAAYRALMKEGMEQENASELAQESFLELMEESAESIRKLCKIPGMYRLIPSIFGKAMPKLFKKDAGFEFQFYPSGKGHVKFDMSRCPYYQACKDIDCAELAPVFCTTDDICYGNMHPNLCWNRTKTLARGGDCCDFDLFIRKEETK